MSAPYPRDGSEYGGYPDLIQPLPHDVNDSAKEQLMLAQFTEAADPDDTIEKQADIIRRRGKDRNGYIG